MLNFLRLLFSFLLTLFFSFFFRRYAIFVVFYILAQVLVKDFFLTSVPPSGQRDVFFPPFNLICKGTRDFDGDANLFQILYHLSLLALHPPPGFPGAHALRLPLVCGPFICPREYPPPEFTLFFFFAVTSSGYARIIPTSRSQPRIAHLPAGSLPSFTALTLPHYGPGQNPPSARGLHQWNLPKMISTRSCAAPLSDPCPPLSSSSPPF